ncbi:MAG: response regulator [Emcibacteraceae bacterium]|nr:response regulator [Emcibacteraceae bacterium]
MPNFVNLRILIVDDNVFIAKTLYSILEAFGVRNIVINQSLEEAEKSFYNKSYDLVFIDFMMQKRAGLNFIKNVRSSKNEKNHSDIPVILNTGVTDIDTIIMARDAGVTEVISKPFSPDQVYMKTRNALQNIREFINVDEYIGPNRRRRKMNKPEWADENDRRGSTVSDPNNDDNQV